MNEENTELPCAEKLRFDTRDQAQASAVVADWQHRTKLKVYLCKNNLHLFLINSAAFSSAHFKSVLLNITTFSSCAFEKFSAKGCINFLGERHIQSKFPVMGYAPDVSNQMV